MCIWVNFRWHNGLLLDIINPSPKSAESLYQCDPLLLQPVNIYLNILNINLQTILKITLLAPQPHLPGENELNLIL